MVKDPVLFPVFQRVPCAVVRVVTEVFPWDYMEISEVHSIRQDQGLEEIICRVF